MNDESPIRDLFPAPAEAILIPTVKQGFLPPVQYFERHAQGTEAEDHARVRTEVLTAMGVPLYAKSTVDFPSKPFRAGEIGKRELPATLTIVQSADIETMRTCIAIIRDGDLLRVLYTKAFEASFRDCEKSFVEIARSSALTRK